MGGSPDVFPKHRYEVSLFLLLLFNSRVLISQLNNLGGHLEDGFIQIGTVKADLKSCLDAASYQISPIEKLYKRLDVSRHSRMID